MPTIDIEIVIRAPIERVFDLNLSVDLHVASTQRTGERAIGGVVTGLMGLGDEVTWEAVHFGIRQRLTTRIVELDRPRHFRDSMVSGAFGSFDHDHDFSAVPEGTLLRDRFRFRSPLGPLGHVADALFLTRYMRGFLRTRLDIVQRVAESDEWQRYLEGFGPGSGG